MPGVRRLQAARTGSRAHGSGARHRRQAGRVRLQRTYKRVSKTALADLIADGFQKGSFAILSTGATTKHGYTLTFDKPLPVYFWPVAVSRFEPLDDGPMSWTSKVTSDRWIATNPHLDQGTVDSGNTAFVKTGQIRKDFTVTITVTKVSQSGTTVVIRSHVYIPEDAQVQDKKWQGMIYEQFPVPKTATYTIDTKDQSILKIDLQGWSNGDKSKEREETNLNFKLCTKTTDGKDKSYPCG